MVKVALKFIAICALLFLLYKAAVIYSSIQWSTYVAQCAEKLELCSLGKQKVSDRLMSEAVDKLYSCVNERQPFVESILVPLPKSHAAISSEPIDYKYAEAFCRPE